MTQQPNDQDLASRAHGNPVVVSDPASELVDPDPAHDTPATPSPVTEEEPKKIDVHFVYAGANAGGQSLWNCSVCNGLLQEDGQPQHRAWHERNGLA